MVPILIFSVLGFDLDFQNKKIINSLDVSIETLPIGALISNFDQKTDLTTPTNLKIAAGNFLDLSIKKENFVTERLGIFGPKDANTRIHLSNLWLLPVESQIITNLNDPKNQATGQILRENLQILPEIILWTQKTTQKTTQIKTEISSLVQNSSQNTNNINSEIIKNQNSSQNSEQILSPSNSVKSGLENNSTVNSSSSKTDSNPKNSEKEKNDQSLWLQSYSLNGLGSTQEVVQKSSRAINWSKDNSQNWQTIGQNSLWDKQNSWLLYKTEKWYLYDLSNLSIDGLVRVSNWQFLSLQKNTLWLFDMEKSTNLDTFSNSTSSNNSSTSTLPNSSQSNSDFSNSDFSNKNSNLAFNSDNSNLSSSTFSNYSVSTSQVENTEKTPKTKFSRQFLESGINQISMSNTSVWIWQNSQIFRMSIEKIENWNPLFFAQNIAINSKCCKFKVKSFLQGNLFLFGNNLWFLPDFDKTKWILVANNVASFESFEEMIFWQDLDGFLQTNNFITKANKYLGQIPFENSQNNSEKAINSRLYYDQNLHRLLIYNQKETWTVWFDKSNPNAANIVYHPSKWLENQICVPKIQDRLQFCLQEENLIFYGNFRIF